jgi:oxygen-independent coproporphyrinogen-3 oxidase
MKIDRSRSERARIKEVHAYIENHMHERQTNKVLHAFPSVRLWHEKEVPARQILAERRNRADKRAFHLYIATPYCPRTDPERCGYCLFPIEVFTGMKQLDTYLDYLEREGQMYREYFEGDSPASIYFGGGTSNLYRADQYPRLMEIVRKVFPSIAPEAVITLEGLPQLFTKEKLRRMKESGINRISMGAQQLNDDLNKLSGRQQTVRNVLQAVEWAQEIGLESNVDLIFGWPRQTLDRMVKELERLIATGIRHITHYELNVGGSSYFALNYRDDLPSVDENLAMYRASKQLLESAGFRQLTTYDWEKVEAPAAAPLYQECVEGFGTYEMFGWGYSGISEFPGPPHAPGWIYMNATSVESYCCAIDENLFPVERGFHFAFEDLRLSFLFRNLQGMQADRKQYFNAYATDVYEEHRPIWDALVERDWAAVTPDKISLIGDGVFYTPLIQTMLGSARTDKLKSSLIARILPISS